MQPFTKTFKAGTHLFRENDHSRELYIVQAGTIRVYRQIGTREVELALMEKGSVFGEMALIDGKPRSASAKAVSDAMVAIVDAQSFESKIKGVPPWFLTIIKIVSSKIRKANKHLQIVGAWNRGAALMLSLSYLLSRDGKPDNEKRLCLDIRETKKKLIQLLGMTHQFIMQQLDFLHVKGLLEIKDSAIIFPDPARFSKYVAFLRMYVRKAFDRLPSLSDAAAQVCEAFAAQRPELAGQETASATCSAEELTGLIAKVGQQERAAEIMTELKQCGLLEPQKKEGTDAKAAPGIFTCDAALMHKLTLFRNFSKMVPPA